MQSKGLDDKAGDILASFSSYADAVIGHAKAVAKENALSVAIKAFLVLMGFVVILTAASFFMFGAAQGLGKLLRVEPWLAYLITGTAFLSITVISFMLVSFKAGKASAKRKAEQKRAAEKLSRDVSGLVDIKKWIREYPFYSTGAAAVAGFTLSGAITAGDSDESDVAGPSSDLRSTDIQASIIAMVLALAEDVLTEAVVPFVKEHLRFKDSSETQSCN